MTFAEKYLLDFIKDLHEAKDSNPVIPNNIDNLSKIKGVRTKQKDFYATNKTPNPKANKKADIKDIEYYDQSSQQEEEIENGELIDYIDMSKKKSKPKKNLLIKDKKTK